MSAVEALRAEIEAIRRYCGYNTLLRVSVDHPDYVSPIHTPWIRIYDNLTLADVGLGCLEYTPLDGLGIMIVRKPIRL